LSKTIEITTAQNVIIEYELAPLRDRILAYLLDFFVFTVSYFLLVWITFKLGHFVMGDHYLVIVWMLYTVLFLLFIFLFDALNNGQTPGKMALNIRVIRLDGKEPRWGNKAIRAILHLMDSVFCVGFIGSMLIKFTARSQRLGDMAGNTTVIKLFSNKYAYNLNDILSIHSLDTYTPQYPQVRNLTERDMIFIKNAIARYQQFPNQAHAAAMIDLSYHLRKILDIHENPESHIEFLKILLRDYIVLTR
jgi:uncharacterized RDD family membrane protein YckC